MEGDDEWNEDFSETFQNYGNDNCWNRRRVILHFDIDCFYAQVEMFNMICSLSMTHSHPTKITK